MEEEQTEKLVKEGKGIAAGEEKEKEMRVSVVVL